MQGHRALYGELDLQLGERGRGRADRSAVRAAQVPRARDRRGARHHQHRGLARPRRLLRGAPCCFRFWFLVSFSCCAPGHKAKCVHLLESTSGC